MNAVMKPITNIGISLLLKISIFEDKSKTEAAKIIGIAKKNENSVAVFLSSPAIRPPIIVDAALDTPGINEKHCAIPIIRACRLLILSTLTLGLFGNFFSMMIITIPPTTNATPTTIGLKRYSLIRL